MSNSFIDPTSVSTLSTKDFELAVRQPLSFDGKVVGLLDSTKHNSDRVLDGIAALLVSSYAVKGFVRTRKSSFSNPLPADEVERLAERCDVVITGVGD